MSSRPNGHRDSSDEDSSPTPPEMRWRERVERAGSLPAYAQDTRTATAVVMHELESIDERMRTQSHQIGEMRQTVDALEEHTLRAIASDEDHRKMIHSLMAEQSSCVHDHARRGSIRGSGTVAGAAAIVYALAESGILARLIQYAIG